MSSMEIGLTPESIKKWKEALQRKNEALEAEGSKIVRDTSIDIESEVSERIAAENTNKGQYLQSIYRKHNGLTAEVGATAAHAPYVEFGTEPHFPPFDPIYEWVWLKRNDIGLKDKNEVYAYAKALVKKIGLMGTKANLQWTDTINKNKPIFNQKMEELLKKVI